MILRKHCCDTSSVTFFMWTCEYKCAIKVSITYWLTTVNYCRHPYYFRIFYSLFVAGQRCTIASRCVMNSSKYKRLNINMRVISILNINCTRSCVPLCVRNVERFDLPSFSSSFYSGAKMHHCISFRHKLSFTFFANEWLFLDMTPMMTL